MRNIHVSGRQKLVGILIGTMLAFVISGLQNCSSNRSWSQNSWTEPKKLKEDIEKRLSFSHIEHREADYPWPDKIIHEQFTTSISDCQLTFQVKRINSDFCEGGKLRTWFKETRFDLTQVGIIEGGEVNGRGIIDFWISRSSRRLRIAGQPFSISFLHKCSGSLSAIEEDVADSIIMPLERLNGVVPLLISYKNSVCMGD
jgi:hypothetical protein